LLLLRESRTRVHVFGAADVKRALTGGYPVLPILERYCGVQRRTLEPGSAHELPGSSVTAERFAVGGDAPRYADVEVEASGFVFRDGATGGGVTYVPGLAGVDDEVIARLDASDVVLVDGTFWRDDELTRLGISDRGARDM